MFKALAEGWHWTPEQIERLTPTQLVRLSPDGRRGGGGGPVTITHPSQYAQLRDAWLKWNSPEALLARAERQFERYLANQR